MVEEPSLGGSNCGWRFGWRKYELIRKKPSITWEKQKMGEISRSKRKGKVVELKGSVLERVKALQVLHGVVWAMLQVGLQ